MHLVMYTHTHSRYKVELSDQTHSCCSVYPREKSNKVFPQAPTGTLVISSALRGWWGEVGVVCLDCCVRRVHRWDLGLLPELMSYLSYCGETRGGEDGGMGRGGMEYQFVLATGRVGTVCLVRRWGAYIVLCCGTWSEVKICMV